MANRRNNPQASTAEAEVETLDQTVYPLPQEHQPDPVTGWEGREPFTFDKA